MPYRSPIANRYAYIRFAVTNFLSAKCILQIIRTLYLFYKEWQASRPSSKALVGEYLKNSLRPTVVYPYAPLMFLVCFF